MFGQTVVLVSDKFKSFTSIDNVLTITQFFQLLSTAPSMEEAIYPKIKVISGQGLSDENIMDMLKLAKLRGLSGMFELAPRAEIAPSSFSHKRFSENTLISKPIKVGDDVYEMDLVIDQNGELMSDHQTGQHVQGMVLMEAARQSFLAVSEAFFIQPGSPPRYFVIKEMRAEYKRFMFPLPAIIRYRVTDMDTSDPSRMRFSAEIDMIQADCCSATFNVSFTIFPEEKISSREGVLAAETLVSYLQLVETKLPTATTVSMAISA